MTTKVNPKRDGNTLWQLDRLTPRESNIEYSSTGSYHDRIMIRRGTVVRGHLSHT